MSAFRRRTTFAAPLIVTVVAGCSNDAKPTPSGQPHSEPQSVPPAVASWTVSMQDMKCVAVKNGTPPPPAQAIECPPGMSGKRKLTVLQKRDDSCVVLPGNHITACPLPVGKALVQKLGIVWTIEKLGADCHAEEEDECPPGMDCNPPKPRTFPCPPGVTDDKPLRFAELPDATCVVVPDGCIDTSCATEKVACPPEYR